MRVAGKNMRVAGELILGASPACGGCCRKFVHHLFFIDSPTTGKVSITGLMDVCQTTTEAGIAKGEKSFSWSDDNNEPEHEPDPVDPVPVRRMESNAF